MPKYRITIDFDTDKEIPFPADARVLSDMTAQLESLDDGDMEEELEGSTITTILLHSSIKLLPCYGQYCLNQTCECHK